MNEVKDGELTVVTGSRLHFGLVRSAAPFGGVGAMIDRPQNVIVIRPSDQWRCDSDYADRILPIAKRLVEHAGMQQLPRCDVQIRQSLATHCGLGSGTQLSLAIAEALCRFTSVDIPPLILATEIADRGKRSAVGVHGYFAGGMIYEAPVAGQSLNPIAQRIELPSDWRVAFLLPPDTDQAISGDQEAECFSRLGNEDAEHIDRLTRAIADRLLPAAAAADFNQFCEAVTQYNQQSGMLFASVQGGSYNGLEVASTIATLQAMGVQGVGQSSWGPGVFAWFESQASLNQFQQDCQSHHFRIMATGKVNNQGRQLIDRR